MAEEIEGAKAFQIQFAAFSAGAKFCLVEAAIANLKDMGMAKLVDHHQPPYIHEPSRKFADAAFGVLPCLLTSLHVM